MISPSIVLASNSPRRKTLLTLIIPAEKFAVLGSKVSERLRRGEDAGAYCLRIAEAKARDVISRYQRITRGASLIIGADTVILLNKEIIGQPKDARHAREILKKLSRKKHEVITGVCLILVKEECAIKFAVKSQVWMKKLNAQVISDYVKTGEPMGKAGAYAIQGRGKMLIKKFRGSYTNIIGLPIEELEKILSVLAPPPLAKLNKSCRA